MAKRYVNTPNNIDGVRVIDNDTDILNAINRGENCYHWEYGNSMSPMIENCEYCFIEPLNGREIKQGDAVFCNVGGTLMVHLVWMVSECGNNEKNYLIGTTSGSLFGWTNEVYGIAHGTDIINEDALKECEYETNSEIENN